MCLFYSWLLFGRYLPVVGRRGEQTVKRAAVAGRTGLVTSLGMRDCLEVGLTTSPGLTLQCVILSVLSLSRALCSGLDNGDTLESVNYNVK